MRDVKMGFRTANAAFRSLAVTLALGAMLLRAALPAGWMPNLGHADGAPLVICSVDGVHHQLPPHEPQNGDEHGFACPFAAAAHLAPPQNPPLLAAPFEIASLSPHFAEATAQATARQHNHAPRGPPASV